MNKIRLMSRRARNFSFTRPTVRTQKASFRSEIRRCRFQGREARSIPLPPPSLPRDRHGRTDTNACSRIRFRTSPFLSVAFRSVHIRDAATASDFYNPAVLLTYRSLISRLSCSQGTRFQTRIDEQPHPPIEERMGLPFSSL